MITEVKLEDLERKYKDIVFGLRMDAAKGGNWKKNTPQEKLDAIKGMYDDYLTDNWTNLLDASTIGDQENGKFKVNYAAFIIRGVRQGFILLEDVYKYKEYLEIFERNKNQYIDRDLGQIKTEEQYRYFKSQTLIIKNKEEEDPSDAKGISKAEKFKSLLVKQANGYSLYKIPQQDEMGGKIKAYYNASCELGSGTEWCTATGNTDQHFNSYTKEGPLYIFLPIKTKNVTPGEKYQYSPATGDFMDGDDLSLPPNFFKREKSTLEPFFDFIQDDYEGGVDTALKMMLGKDLSEVEEDFQFYFDGDPDRWAEGLLDHLTYIYEGNVEEGELDNDPIVKKWFKSEQLDPYNYINWLKLLATNRKTFEELTSTIRSSTKDFMVYLFNGLDMSLPYSGGDYLEPYLDVFYESVIVKLIDYLVHKNNIKDFDYKGNLGTTLNDFPKDKKGRL